MAVSWPATAAALIELQEWLGRQNPPDWRPGSDPLVAAGCFVCFERGGSGSGAAGERGWAGVAALCDGRLLGSTVVSGFAGAAYLPGLLALREGPLLEQALRTLAVQPDVLLVNATGRDHPRRAGLALHLGAVLGVPSIGITHRPLYASGDWPPDEMGSVAPLLVQGELVGYWLRTRRGRRPLAVHAGWRTDPKTAAVVVLMATRGARTPEPLRVARELARTARALAVQI